MVFASLSKSEFGEEVKSIALDKLRASTLEVCRPE